MSLLRVLQGSTGVPIAMLAFKKEFLLKVFKKLEPSLPLGWSHPHLPLSRFLFVPNTIKHSEPITTSNSRVVFIYLYSIFTCKQQAMLLLLHLSAYIYIPNMSTNNKMLFPSLLMEKNWVPKSDSSATLSNLESMGDSEAELAIDTDMVLDTFVSNVIDSDDYNDDAESTSGDDSWATNGNIGQDMRRQVLCKNWWYDLYDAKKRIVDDGEIIEGQRDSMVLVAREEAVVAEDDAESNRLFWDACIAHGY